MTEPAREYTRFEYRCRRCSEVFGGPTCPRDMLDHELHALMGDPDRGTKASDSYGGGRSFGHACADGGQGYSDLIGIEAPREDRS